MHVSLIFAIMLDMPPFHLLPLFQVSFAVHWKVHSLRSAVELHSSERLMSDNVMTSDMHAANEHFGFSQMTTDAPEWGTMHGYNVFWVNQTLLLNESTVQLSCLLWSVHEILNETWTLPDDAPNAAAPAVAWPGQAALLFLETTLQAHALGPGAIFWDIVIWSLNPAPLLHPPPPPSPPSQPGPPNPFHEVWNAKCYRSRIVE